MLIALRAFYLYAKWDRLKTGFLRGFEPKKFGFLNFFRIFWSICIIVHWFKVWIHISLSLFFDF